MPEGLNRFQIQLAKIEQIIASLPATERALTFYQSPARQYLFYLEALTHIYKKIHSKKRFERMRLAFKALEDQLGKVDYYDGFIKEFSVQEKFPVELLDWLKQHKANELNILDEKLINEGWLNQESGVLKTIMNELESAKWLSEPKDRKAIGEVFIEEIERIESDYHSGKLNFKDIENGVHEFRRQIRWLSIYAQALNGLIQIKKVEAPDPKLKSYLTKEVLESPFNVMPVLKAGVEPIYIEAPNFYALSWLIAESGKLKDNGLRIICVEEAIRETGYVHERSLKAVTKTLAIKSTQSPREIKETMKVLGDKFMHHDKVLDRIRNDVRISIGM